MRCVELTIHLDGIDISRLLKPWHWLVPEDCKPIQISKFGDWFLVASNGQVLMLDLLEGELTPIAQTVQQYNQMKNQPDQQSRWFMDGFVFRCESEGLKLSKAQCYGWKIHPMIGGKFEFENIQVLELFAYQSLMGQLLPQWKRLKPGDAIPPIVVTE